MEDLLIISFRFIFQFVCLNLIKKPQKSVGVNFCGAKSSKIELFWGGFGIIKIKYRLNKSTFRYGN